MGHYDWRCAPVSEGPLSTHFEIMKRLIWSSQLPRSRLRNQSSHFHTCLDHGRLERHMGDRLSRTTMRHYPWHSRQWSASANPDVFELRPSAIQGFPKTVGGMLPTYEYQCTQCSERLEAVQSFTDDALKECPNCGEPTLRKLFGNVGVVFKGSGFYRNDSREEHRKKSKEAEKSKPSVKDSSSNADSSKSDSASRSGTKSGDKTKSGAQGSTSTGSASTKKESGSKNSR